MPKSRQRKACSSSTTRRRASARPTRDKPLGTFGLATATSFFPAKPLGCYGDGGAIFTDDDVLADVIRSLRVHGQGTDKYDNVRIGMTGRLDTIQAAVLIEKLKIFPDEIAARDADRAALQCSGSAMLPSCRSCRTTRRSVWAQYTIRLAPGRRDGLAAALKARRHSDRDLLSEAPAPAGGLRGFPVADGGLPVSDRLADEVISLPMHAYLDETVQDRIVEAVRRALAR